MGRLFKPTRKLNNGRLWTRYSEYDFGGVCDGLVGRNQDTVPVEVTINSSLQIHRQLVT